MSSADSVSDVICPTPVYAAHITTLERISRSVFQTPRPSPLRRQKTSLLPAKRNGSSRFLRARVVRERDSWCVVTVINDDSKRALVLSRHLVFRSALAAAEQFNERHVPNLCALFDFF